MNSISISRRLLAATTLIALAACSGGAHSIPATPTGSGTGSGPVSTAATSRTVTTLTAPAALTASATRIGPATTANSIMLHVVPNLQNAAGLATYAQQASTPGSPNYRQFLTPSDIGSRFGATSTDYAAVANYFASYGLKVGGWPQRLALTVAGPRTSMERALGTTFQFYKTHEGHTIIAPLGNIQFAKPIPVASIPDAVMVPTLRHMAHVGSPSINTLSGYAPQQIATAFDYTSAYTAGFTGSGMHIAIIGTGPAMSIDFNTYKSNYGLSGASTLAFPAVSAAAAANTGGSPTATPPAVTATTASCNSSTGGNGSGLPPSEAPTSTCNPEDGEAQIDTEQAALARDATIDFYLAYVPAECDTPNAATCTPDPSTGLGYAYQGLAESDDEIQQIIANDTDDVVSGSYGGAELFYYYYSYTGIVTNSSGALDPSALEPAEMSAMAAEGMAVFFSSADQGAYVCGDLAGGALATSQCVSYPASDPNVTAVGGVTLPLNPDATLAGPITGWGAQTGDGASGGGVSCIAGPPSWEVQPSYETGSLLTAAGSSGCAAFGLSGSSTGRVLPDVSLEGDPTTGVAVIGNVAFPTSDDPSVGPYGGTSVAAPEMAAMWALVLQACQRTSSCATAGGSHPYRLGNAAPYFWRAYQTQSTYLSTIYDVTFGNNGVDLCNLTGPSCPAPITPGYSAGSGWDGVTGLGVPFARHLIKTVVGI